MYALYVHIYAQTNKDIFMYSVEQNFEALFPFHLILP